MKPKLFTLGTLALFLLSLFAKDMHTAQGAGADDKESEGYLWLSPKEDAASDGPPPPARRAAPGWDEGVYVNAHGNLEGDGRFRKQPFGDFVLQFEFRSQPAANSGIGIRTSSDGNPAFHGMEIQVLDDGHPSYANIERWQHHGSVYGVVAAKTGYLKPTGEWNREEIRAVGDHITVTLNGTVLVDAHLKEAAPNGKSMDGKEHPGLFNTTGYIALCGHGGGVEFRNLRIKPLPSSPAP